MHQPPPGWVLVGRTAGGKFTTEGSRIVVEGWRIADPLGTKPTFRSSILDPPSSILMPRYHRPAPATFWAYPRRSGEPGAVRGEQPCREQRPGPALGRT